MNSNDFDNNYLEEKEFQEELDNLWDEYNPEDYDDNDAEIWYGDY